jgi:hypothetical protein
LYGRCIFYIFENREKNSIYYQLNTNVFEGDAAASIISAVLYWKGID